MSHAAVATTPPRDGRRPPPEAEDGATSRRFVGSPLAWDLREDDAPESVSRHYSPRGPLKHGLDGWDSPPLERHDSTDDEITESPLYDVGDLHSALAAAPEPPKPQPRKPAPRLPGEDDGGCPGWCTKYGPAPIVLVLLALLAVIYMTSYLAHMSTVVDDDKAAALELRRREQYQRRKQAETQPDEDTATVDLGALLCLVLSSLLGVVSGYSYCTRPRVSERVGLPSQEETEREAAACRADAALQGGHGAVDTEADSDRAALLGAFQACDIDGSGQIDTAELYRILVAVGAQITVAQVEDIVAKCEARFALQARNAAILERIPLFADLPKTTLLKVVDCLECVEYGAGDAVIREGDQYGSHMFVVEAGSLACTKSGINAGQTLRMYGPGDYFGERALLVSESRMATITALCPCKLHRLSSRDSRRLLFPHQGKVLKQLQLTYTTTVLRKVDLLRGLPPSELEAVAATLQYVTFRAGQTVIAAGSSGEDMFIVEMGTCVANRGGEDDGALRRVSHSRELPLKHYVEGDFFGERALIHKERRAATVSAVSDVRLLKLSSEALAIVMKNRTAREDVRAAANSYSTGRPEIVAHLSGANNRWKRGLTAVSAFKPIALGQRVSEQGVEAMLDAGGAARGAAAFASSRAVAVGQVAAGSSVAAAKAVAKLTGLSPGNSGGSFATDTQDGQLDFEEFCLLMRSDQLQPFLAATGDDWMQRVTQIQSLRRAYDTADVDGDNALELSEFRMVLLALDPSASVSQDDVAYVWALLNPDGRASVGWGDFLCGMDAVMGDERAASILHLDQPNKWSLISLLVDTVVSEQEEAELLANMSFFEKVGVETLKKQKRDMDTERVSAVLRRACEGTLHVLDDDKKHAIRRHLRVVALQAFLIALLTNLVPALWEHYIIHTTASNGVADAYWVCNQELFSPGFPHSPVNESIAEEQLKACDRAPLATIATFWAMNIPMVVLCLGIELLLLGMAAVRCACSIAGEYEFRLVPLNAERVFVSNAMIRTCFEMGASKSPVFGVDPEAGMETTLQRRLKIFLMAAIFAGKIALTTLLLKQLSKLVLPIFVWTWTNSHCATVACCFWDTLICARIMEEVEICAMGVACAPEVFNEVMDRLNAKRRGRPMSTLGQLQVVRAIGVAIVLEGSMHPTMELLLRHAIQYFGLKSSPMLAEPRNLDSIPRFLSDLPKLDPDEQLAVMCVHLLTQMLDGAMDDPELELWQRIAIAIERSTGMDEQALKGVAFAFRFRHLISAEVLEEALEGDTHKQLSCTESSWFGLTELLMKG